MHYTNRREVFSESLIIGYLGCFQSETFSFMFNYSPWHIKEGVYILKVFESYCKLVFCKDF